MDDQTTYNMMNLTTGKCTVKLTKQQVEDKYGAGSEIHALAEVIEEHGVFESDEWLIWNAEQGIPGLACHAIVSLYYDDHITSVGAIALIKMATDSADVKTQSIDVIKESYGP